MAQIAVDMDDANARANASAAARLSLNACFDGETLVALGGEGEAAGDENTYWLELWHVRVGHHVLSRCEFTDEMAYKKVVKVFQHEHAEVFDVWYDCGLGHKVRHGTNPSPILATVEHPFWVEEKAWVKVGQLQPGDKFLTHDGTQATVTRVEKRPYRLEVYNLEVEDFHTYFVGYPGVLVHNKSKNAAG